MQYFGVPGRGAAYGDVGDPGGHNPAMSFGSIKKTKTRMAYSRDGDVTAYEWAIQVFDHFPDTPTKLVPGKRIGFDVAVVDKDSAEGNPAWVCWGPTGVLKFLDAGLLGDLILGLDLDRDGRQGPAGRGFAGPGPAYLGVSPNGRVLTPTRPPGAYLPPAPPFEGTVTRIGALA